MTTKKPDAFFSALLNISEEDRSYAEAEQDIWERFGETCAILVLDSTGFSRTTKRKGIVYFLSLIAQMRQIARTLCEAHGALSARFEADNLFAEFSTPAQALTVALALHEQIAAADLLLYDDEAYRVGIGIGYGEVLRTQREGVFGHEMNLASKLGEDTSEGGDTLLTLAAFEALTDQEGLVVSHHRASISGVDFPYVRLKKILTTRL